MFGRILLTLFICSSLLFSCKNSNRLVHQRDKLHTSNSSKKSSIQKKYADILGVNTDKIKNIKLYEFIDEWYGVPYKYGGQSKSGVDCSGFINTLFLEVYGKKVPRTTTLIAKQARHVSKANIKEGDVVIFDIQGKKHSHVGVYLENGKFVHASSSKGVIISNLNSSYYQNAFGNAGRF